MAQALSEIWNGPGLRPALNSACPRLCPFKSRNSGRQTNWQSYQPWTIAKVMLKIRNSFSHLKLLLPFSIHEVHLLTANCYFLWLLLSLIFSCNLQSIYCLLPVLRLLAYANLFSNPASSLLHPLLVELQLPYWFLPALTSEDCWDTRHWD